MNEATTFWVWLLAVWFVNINDLIRGEWFYHNIKSILFLNFLGILSLFGLISHYKSKITQKSGKVK